MREKFDLLWEWRLTELRINGFEVDKLLLPTFVEIMCPDPDHPYFSFRSGLGAWTIASAANFTIQRREDK